MVSAPVTTITNNQDFAKIADENKLVGDAPKILRIFMKDYAYALQLTPNLILNKDGSVELDVKEPVLVTWIDLTTKTSEAPENDGNGILKGTSSKAGGMWAFIPTKRVDGKVFGGLKLVPSKYMEIVVSTTGLAVLHQGEVSDTTVIWVDLTYILGIPNPTSIKTFLHCDGKYIRDGARA